VGSNASNRKRCAVYTRKSSEEGLEQDFNSLDAQREACEAYIRSQKSEGWQPVRTHYDDGGFSGGNLERPALTRLLADIEASKIDTVVVYKVDRLTRSLADFAKIVEILDAHGVTFVSVTQQFNTTTSMGRLTLNMLLSFAQFEREVTGERIRDKIGASKRKGLWMGGHVPLGYEANGRTLEINVREAKTVRTLFELYLELGSVRLLMEKANRLGLRSKVRKAKGNKMRGGRPLGRGHLYHLLSNPIYIGRIPHNGDSYEGQHPPIIDPETWGAVQRQLMAQAPTRSKNPSRKTLSPLQGKLFDEMGTRLTPSHAVKSGRRYRYYVARARPSIGSAVRQQEANTTWRLSAGEIEGFVGRSVLNLLSTSNDLADCARSSGVEESLIPRLIDGAAQWSGKPIDLVERVDLSEAEIAIHLTLSPFMNGENVTVRHVVPAQIRKRGVERRLGLGAGADVRDHRGVDAAMIKGIARARKWLDNLVSGQASSLGEIARAEGLSEQYVSKLLPLAFLAPGIVEQVVAGAQPADLSVEDLIKRVDLPLSWADQRSMLGFR
jgi:DNA invertase Pin-like site-specific DNA recombinase